MRLIHNITHRHLHGQKEGVGEFIFCAWRFQSNGHLMFRPDLDGAAWHPVPDNCDPAELLAQPDFGSIMAMIRKEAAA